MNTRKLLPLVLLSALCTPALAQSDEAPVPFGLVRGMPQNDGQTTAANVARESVVLDAIVRPGADPLEDGLSWHVFEREGNRAGKLVAVRNGGSQNLRLPVGEYVAHVAYGQASAVVPFTLRVAGAKLDAAVLNAGGVSFAAEAGGVPIEGEDVRFSIYEVDGERRTLIRADIPSGETVQLNAGLYRAIGEYGDTNAVGTADIRVQAGEVTETTLGVPGAPITLKLVREEGGAPLAATSWRVFDGEGEQVFESDEPSPGTILGAGTYTAEAVNDGDPITESFTVTPGEPADITVLAPTG